MTDLTVFAFDSAAVRTLVRDGDPWFVAGDVANVLGYRDASNMVRMLDEDEADTHNLSTSSENGVVQDREVTIINESGLYACVLKSRRPEAKAFRKWITSEVLPALRRNGQYAVPGPGQAALFATGNPAHAADQLVSADRIFRGILRSSRSAGLPLARALRRANEVAKSRTGIDLLTELDAPDLTCDDLAVLDPSGVSAFCDAWMAGGLPIPALPCRSADIYAAYCHWRMSSGELAVGLPRFVAAVGRRLDLRHRRARYLTEDGRVAMAGFVLPEHELMPPSGVSQTDWLTSRAKAFTQALATWRSPPG